MLESVQVSLRGDKVLEYF